MLQSRSEKRIATVAWANHEVPLALGVVPVGMSEATWGDDDGDGVLPWVEEKLEELGRTLLAEDYHLLLFTGFKDRDSDPVFDQLMQYRVDGIILASTSLSSELSEECTAAGIPVVLFNRTTERNETSSVTSDNRAGGRVIAEFLVAGGHKSFAKFHNRICKWTWFLG